MRHRVIPDFMIQAGGFQADDSGERVGELMPRDPARLEKSGKLPDVFKVAGGA